MVLWKKIAAGTGGGKEKIMTMFWDEYGTAIKPADSKANTAANRQRTLEDKLRKTNDRMEALMVACQAMWEILRDEGGVSEVKLLKKIEEVDLRSGKADGKMPQEDAIICGNCDRKNGHRHNLCLYCGSELPPAQKKHAFNVK